MSKTNWRRFLNKTNITALIVGLLTALSALVFIYSDALHVQSEQLPAMEVLPEIVEGDLYRQSFVPTSDGLTKIRLLPATYARINEGTMTVSLEDNEGQNLGTWQYDVSTLPDNSYIDLTLNNRIEDCSGRTYYLNVSSTSSNDSAATLYTTVYGGSSGLMHNGEALGCSLCFMLEYDLPGSSLLNAGMIITTILLLILFPVLTRIAMHFFPENKIALLVFIELAAVIGCHRILKHAALGAFPPALLAAAFFILCVLWALASIVLYRLIFIRKISIQKTAVIALSVFAVMMIGFLTPGTGNDEQVHYAYAYKYANFFSFKGLSEPVDEEGNVLFYMREDDAELLKTFRDVPVYITEASYKNTAKSFTLFCSDNFLHEYRLTDVADNSSFTANNAPLGYIASGIGIALGRLLHLGAVPTFYLGRVFNAALFILLVYLSIRIIPVGKETLFVLSLFPMVLQQAVTYSYDSSTLGILFLFTSVTVAVFMQREKITAKQFVILALLSVAVALCKFVYAPLILILLAVPSDKLNVRNPRAVKLIVTSAIAVCGIIAFAVLQSRVHVLDYFIPSYAPSSGGSVFAIVARYYEMLQMTAIEISDFYMHSMVAYPGWYQIYVPVTITTSFYLMLFMSLTRRKGEDRFPGMGIKIYGAVLIIISVILITLPMAAKFTDIDSATISSIQGRYFLPLMPLLCMGLRIKHLRADESLMGKVQWGTCYIGFIFFGFCFLKIFGAI